MNGDLYVETKALPPAIQRVLADVGFHKKDIRVNAMETTEIAQGGSDGRRAFVALVNLETGESKVLWGSWGGGSPSSQPNHVDSNNNLYQIPKNGVVVRGSVGEWTYAHIELRPETLAPMLPAKNDLSDRDCQILYAFKAYRPGEYRKRTLAELGCTEDDLNRLAKEGFLKRSSNGATQITTAGRNSAEKRGKSML